MKSSVFEKLAQPPPGWSENDGISVDKDGSIVALRIHLVPQKMSDFHDIAMKVCSPAHLFLIFLTEVIDCNTRPRALWKTSLSGCH